MKRLFGLVLFSMGFGMTLVLIFLVIFDLMNPSVGFFRG